MKCGMITHSTKETRQQKEQWEWGLEVTGKWGGGRVGQNLKKSVVGNIGRARDLQLIRRGLAVLCQLGM